jgi:hypothetical protein
LILHRMITKENWLKLVSYKIVDSSKWCWLCFGPNVHFLSAGSADDGFYASIIFDTSKDTVYQVEITDYRNNRCYQMTNPDYNEAYQNERRQRNNHDYGLDDHSLDQPTICIELEIVNDFMTKAAAIVAGEQYDSQIQFPLETLKDDLLILLLAAHSSNMTFNEYIQSNSIMQLTSTALIKMLNR